MSIATAFRPFRPDDRAAVVRLWHDAWHDGHGAVLPAHVVAERTMESFDLRLGPLEAGCLVAEADGRLLGFAIVEGNEIDQFYVAAEARGTGLATAMLAAAETQLARRGVRDAVIQCSAGNDRAHRFYARAGWRDSGVRQAPIWTPDGRHETHPTHIFVKQLSSLD
ncbi:GCN5-related N-acetyltransferase [uncultured Pleomorphomonas sp.]|uniref:GCN5-related N-acetyltransferase n=1 Tax=uncultured Pleomorphomonas sp. TaxID=442121 RepID=A0A212L4K3_9HYPH|nr:GNAT family N-acetyltransferase [uncultured Pleomorphomonas sp.]SCM72504.1 GCN5-related N-acetyltransferase [uncultured Pleomorphomonas sp.]